MCVVPGRSRPSVPRGGQDCVGSLCPVSVYVVPGRSGPSVPRGGLDCVVSLCPVSVYVVPGRSGPSVPRGQDCVVSVSLCVLSQGAAGLQSLEEDWTVLCLCVQCLVYVVPGRSGPSVPRGQDCVVSVSLCVLSHGAAGLQSLEEDRTVLSLCPVSVYVVPGYSGPSVPRGGQDCVVSLCPVSVCVVPGRSGPSVPRGGQDCVVTMCPIVCVCCPRVQRAFSP